MSARSRFKRGAATVAGILILLFSAWASLVALLFVGFAAQAPDAFVPDGDPCCGTPDTWREVIEATVPAAVVVVVVSLLLALAFALLTWALRQAWPRRRTIAFFPAISVAALAVILVVVWATDTPRLQADCDGFRLRLGDWQSSSSDGRLRAADAVGRCGVLRQLPASDVTRLLGQPASKHPVTYERRDGDTVWLFEDIGNENASEDSPHSLSVYFRGGRVSAARFSAACC